MRTKRMNRKDIELLMGGEDGEGGVFTWREKHGRKVCCDPSPPLRMRKGCKQLISFVSDSWHIQCTLLMFCFCAFISHLTLKSEMPFSCGTNSYSESSTLHLLSAEANNLFLSVTGGYSRSRLQFLV